MSLCRSGESLAEYKAIGGRRRVLNHLAFYEFPAEHWKHLRTTDVLDKGSSCLRQYFLAASIEWRARDRKRALPRDPTGTRRLSLLKSPQG